MEQKERAAMIISLLEQSYPKAGTMLDFSNEFECLVAVILSAQSTDQQVNKVTAQLFRNYNKPEHFVQMERQALEKHIKGVGLYKNKARHIQAMSQILLDEYDGRVPDDFNELLRLPGVGRKTANVMMSVAFNKPGLGVDTHVQRVANRTGLVASKRPDHTEQALKRMIPSTQWSQAHHLFIFHGRQVCKARKPDCDACVIKAVCARIID